MGASKRRRRYSFNTALQWLCNGSATALQRLCNSSTTALLSPIYSRPYNFPYERLCIIFTNSSTNRYTNGSATALQRLCNGSATALQRLCNGFATARQMALQ